MIAVDTNILVYAHREDSSWHEAASARVSELAEGRSLWAIPWPCMHEFLAIATHPRIYSPPTPLHLAIDQVQAWQEAPKLELLTETAGYWRYLRELLVEGKISGGRIHDARIAALCLIHGVQELWTADRDFSRFNALNVSNPLIA